jgi:hypothetical protein
MKDQKRDEQIVLRWISGRDSVRLGVCVTRSLSCPLVDFGISVKSVESSGSVATQSNTPCYSVAVNL